MCPKSLVLDENIKAKTDMQYSLFYMQFVKRSVYKNKTKQKPLPALKLEGDATMSVKCVGSS